MKRLRIVATTVTLLVGVLGHPAPGQDATDATAADTYTPPALAREAAASMLEAPLDELKVLVVPLPADQLEVLSAEVIARLQTAAGATSVAIIDEKRRGDAGTEPAGDEDRLPDLVEAQRVLVARANVVLDAFEAKGGDVAAARAYVAAVLVLEPTRVTPATSEAGDEASEQSAVDAEVDALIAAVRDAPPVHDRASPWTVPTSELELELQPLTAEQIDERVQKWLAILARELRARIRMDIALSRAEGSEARSELAKRSTAQQEVIQAIVERIEVALVLLQRRGGDPKAARDYIASATGKSIDLTDPAVMYAQGLAWLRSADGGVKLGINILKFLSTLIAFWLASKIVARIVSVAMRRVPNASSLLSDFVIGGTRRVVLIIGLVIAISALGVNITPLIAAIGAIGLVVGLALQGTLSNFASGMLILVYRPFDVGDLIDAGGVVGRVEAMNLMSTSVLTLDNQSMYVPNNEIWNGVITNITGQQTRRVDMVFGIGYADDIGKAIALIEEVAAAHPQVLEDPAPVVRVHELGDNSVNMVVRPWARTEDYWDVYWDLTRQIKDRFDAEGINIPFPQRDLHVPGTIEVRLASPGAAAAPSATVVEPRPEPRSVASTSTRHGADAPPSSDGAGADDET